MSFEELKIKSYNNQNIKQKENLDSKYGDSIINGGEEVFNGEKSPYEILKILVNKGVDINSRVLLRKIILDNPEILSLENKLKKGDKLSIINEGSNIVKLIIGESGYKINLKNNSIEKTKVSDIDKLIGSINIITKKAFFGMLAGKRDIYTIKAGDKILWVLPTTAQPVVLCVDIDPKKVLEKTKSVLRGENIDNIKIEDLLLNKNTNIKKEDTDEILNDFKLFIEALKNGKEFEKLGTISSTH